jgi:hypothetical protein
VANVVDNASANRAQQAAQDRATQFLGEVAPTLIKNSQVLANVDTDRVVVDVRGDGITIVPGFTVRIHEHSEGPVERFRGDT